MDRFVTFNNIGARVEKGNYTPKEGELFVKNPSSVPVCSIHYWKYDNGKIVEMSDSEKLIVNSNIDLSTSQSTNIKQFIQSDVQTIKAITEIDVEHKIKEELAKIPVYQIEDFLKQIPKQIETDLSPLKDELQQKLEVISAELKKVELAAASTIEELRDKANEAFINVDRQYLQLHKEASEGFLKLEANVKDYTDKKTEALEKVLSFKQLEKVNKEISGLDAILSEKIDRDKLILYKELDNLHQDFLNHKTNLKEDLEKLHKLSIKQILGIIGVSGITYLLIHLVMH